MKVRFFSGAGLGSTPESSAVGATASLGGLARLTGAVAGDGRGGLTACETLIGGGEGCVGGAGLSCGVALEVGGGAGFCAGFSGSAGAGAGRWAVLVGAADSV